MQNKIWLVAIREFVKIVRKKSFWLATLALPAFLIVVIFISGTSSSSVEENIEKAAKAADEILIVDPSVVIDPQLYAKPFIKSNNFEESLGKVKSGTADALFFYPTDIRESSKIQVYTKDIGLLSRGRFDNVASDLIKQSILLKVGDKEKIALFNTNFKLETTNFKDGKVVPSAESFIVPGLLVLFYFIIIIFSANQMLTSMSEEKENRVAEIMLTILKPREIVWGKIAGLSAVALSQLVILSTLGLAIAYAFSDKLPFEINLASLSYNPGQLAIGVFYLLFGFLFFSTVMVGLGSALPSYKEAAGFSPIFTILAISPVYFITIILQNPSGAVALGTSYFPFTAPLILLIRNALGQLSTFEVVVSILAMTTYVVLGLFVAFKLFELGAMEYSQKISLKNLFKR